MRPGPTHIVACPNCGGLSRHHTLTSGNTIGARVWTDGKQVAPMLPLPPEIVACSHCSEFFWLEDAEVVGMIDHRGIEEDPIDPAWSDAPRVEEPTERGYYQAIEKGLATTPEREEELRILAWWRGNDPFREVPGGQAPDHSKRPAQWKENLQALVQLLDTDDEENCLMKAEGLRELAQFEAARKVLDRVDSPDLIEFAQELRALIDAQDTCVRELWSD